MHCHPTPHPEKYTSKAAINAIASALPVPARRPSLLKIRGVQQHQSAVSLHMCYVLCREITGSCEEIIVIIYDLFSKTLCRIVIKGRASSPRSPVSNEVNPLHNPVYPYKTTMFSRIVSKASNYANYPKAHLYFAFRLP